MDLTKSLHVNSFVVDIDQMEFTLHQPVSHKNRKSIERVRFDTGGYNIRYYQKKAFQFADSTGYIVNTNLNVSGKG